MPTNNGPHERDGEVPRWAATAGQHRFRTPRWASRLFCTYRRTSDDTEPEVIASDLPWSVRDRVLREYHAATLAEARHASEQWVRAGFNTGAVPYGYRARRVRVAPAGRRPRWRTRLVIEPVEAATVKMIFTWRGEDGLTIAAIGQRLVAARYPAPLDPETGQPGVWTHTIITAVLRNPKYLGRQVWGRHHHGRRAPLEVWVWSAVWAHPPIVSTEEFVAANRRTGLATALVAADSPVAGWTDREGGVVTNPDFFFTDDDVSTRHDFYPDGLTPEAITAVQRDVERELRRGGYPVRDGQRPTTRRSARARVELGIDRTLDPSVGPAPESCASPQPGVPGQPGGTGAAEGAGPSTGESAGDPVPTLFTPTQAADLLQVPESWLRRRAARRLVPCTFLGKHLRFSRANLHQIIADAARPAGAARRSASDTGPGPRRRGRPPLRTRTDSRRPTR